jgi:hypothetical protein
MIDHRRVLVSLLARPGSTRVPTDQEQMIGIDTLEGFAAAERQMASRSSVRES